MRPLSSESGAHSATASQAPDGPGLPARVCLGTVGRLFRARTHSPQKPRAMVSNLELAVSAGRCRTCGLCGDSSGGGVSPRQAWNAGAASSCVGPCFVEIVLWSAKGTHVDMRPEEQGAAALLHPDHSCQGPGHTAVCRPVQEADVTGTSSLKTQAQGGQATWSHVPPDLSAARASRGHCSCPRVAEGRGWRAWSHARPWRQLLPLLALLLARQAPFQAGSALEVMSTSDHSRSSGSWRMRCPPAPGRSAMASGTMPPPGPQRSVLPRDMSRPGLQPSSGPPGLSPDCPPQVLLQPEPREPPHPLLPPTPAAAQAPRSPPRF